MGGGGGGGCVVFYVIYIRLQREINNLNPKMATFIFLICAIYNE